MRMSSPPTQSDPTARPDSIVVYTAITRDYDSLKEPPQGATDKAAFVAFLDRPAASSAWQSWAVHRQFPDPCRNAKIHKILSHVYFPNAQYSLWIDGSVSIRFTHSIQELIERYLAECDVVVFQHRTRTCIYQEGSVCLQRGLDDPGVILQQVSRYTREGYPSNAGLAECSVVLRRHSPAVRAFNEAWWEEITRGSKRDQLSFPYLARKMGLRYGTFPGTIGDTTLFHRGPHTAPSPDARVRSMAPAPHIEVGPPARKTVAFGPVRDRPSWHWVGFDTAREISKYYNVVTYDSVSPTPPQCDVLFVIKSHPSEGFVAEALRQQSKLVYCPIDAYRDPDDLTRQRDFLRACAMVVVHCERLLPLMRSHCANTHFVEHHTRYALKEMASYKDTGFLLWIGACQYLPYLVRWLERHPLEHEIKILTDIDSDKGRAAAHALAAEIGLPLEISRQTTSIAGHRVHQWSERRQVEMMQSCKAALDVKMADHFNQYHKPPTKVQKYIASGVPVAVNPDSYSAEYFRVRGFELASPLDPARWLSRQYWEATRLCGEGLRTTTSLEAVGRRYRALIESLWHPRAATTPARPDGLTTVSQERFCDRQ